MEEHIDCVTHAKRSLNDFLELIELSSDGQDSDVIDEAVKQLKHLEESLKKREVECMFVGEADESDCFIEIHAGAGGTESHDWASMLFRMYTMWIEKHKFKSEIIYYLAGEEAGVKSVVIKVIGKGAYGWLRTESGVHRLVRISPFNSAGKRHTSFASAWIFPVVDNSIEIKINESDLRIDTFRSSGAGGQHVNTTDSAVRITHMPTGIVVSSQSQRSQHQNKDECFSMLKARLYTLELKKQEEKISELNAEKTDIGWGYQIRSYVLHPYQMVKDLRTGCSTSDVTGVLNGDIDKFILASLEAKMKGVGLEPKLD